MQRLLEETASTCQEGRPQEELGERTSSLQDQGEERLLLKLPAHGGVTPQRAHRCVSPTPRDKVCERPHSPICSEFTSHAVWNALPKTPLVTRPSSDAPGGHSLLSAKATNIVLMQAVQAPCVSQPTHTVHMLFKRQRPMEPYGWPASPPTLSPCPAGSLGHVSLLEWTGQPRTWMSYTPGAHMGVAPSEAPSRLCEVLTQGLRAGDAQGSARVSA